MTVITPWKFRAEIIASGKLYAALWKTIDETPDMSVFTTIGCLEAIKADLLDHLKK